MAIITAALFLPHTIAPVQEPDSSQEPFFDPAKFPENSLIFPAPQLPQQPHAMLSQDIDVPFNFARKEQLLKPDAPTEVRKLIVDDRKAIASHSVIGSINTRISRPKSPQVVTPEPDFLERKEPRVDTIDTRIGRPKSPQPPATPETKRYSRGDSIRRRRSQSIGPVSKGQDPPAYKLKRQHGGNGGLYNAMNRALQKGIVNEVKWVGLTGYPSDLVSPRSRTLVCKEYEAMKSFPVFVDDTTFVGHYEHFCKDILFPTFHCQMPEIPMAKAYQDKSWKDYCTLNRMIADRIVEVYQPGDSIWIHDYHLMLVPQYVREKIPNAPIGFFMHIAFPTSEVFRCLASRALIMKGMLAANCVGFQTEEYAQHFMMTASRILAYDTSNSCIQTPDLDVYIMVCPIGIDPERLNEIARTSRVLEHAKVIRKRWPNMKIIGARDKLDPIRGIVPKLKAFKSLLEEHPELRNKCVLVQVCLNTVGSDDDLDAEVASIADSINSRFGDLASGVHPVVLLHQDIVFEQYLALLTEADIFAVTSLRDGMNLTCHEFVYCNERNGPVILSEFTGSASVFQDDAILVNPWDNKGLKDAFYRALTMSDSEKKTRWHNLRTLVVDHTGEEWVEFWIEQLQKSWEDDQARTARKPNIPYLKELYHDADNSARLIMFEIPVGNALSEQGSQNQPPVSNKTRPSLARRTTLHSTGAAYFASRIVSVLNKLLDDPRNNIYVTSSESRAYMERTFRQLPSVGLVAESGKYIRPQDSDEWVEVNIRMNCQWKEQLQPILERLQERLPVSNLRVLDYTVMIDFDFKNDEDKQRELTTVGEYVSLIDDTLSSEGVRIHFEHSQLVVYTSELISLRTRVLRKLFDTYLPKNVGLALISTLPLASDEDDLQYAELLKLKSKGFANSIINIVSGNHPSLANYSVEGINSLLTLLETVHSA